MTGFGPKHEGDVLEALETGRKKWEAACEVALAMSGNALPAADSPAMAELADERRFTKSGWTEPVAACHTAIRVGLFAVNDHLRNYARLFKSEPVPVYSHLVLARAAIETAAAVNWLAEPMTSDQRVMRYRLTRLSDANSMDLGHAPGPARDKGKALRLSIRKGADGLGWTYRKGGRGTRPQVGAEEQATTREQIDQLLAAAAMASQMGDLLWWYLSGVAHGELHALRQSIKVETDRANPLAAGANGAFFTHAGMVAVMGQATLEAHTKTMTTAAQLFGWESAAWVSVLHDTHRMGQELIGIVQELNQGDLPRSEHPTAREEHPTPHPTD